jgi:hypothetical protein
MTVGTAKVPAEMAVYDVKSVAIKIYCDGSASALVASATAAVAGITLALY